MSGEPSSPGHLVSICEDISDRKRAEGILKRQEQMAAIGRLTSSILHEINNPLEAVDNLIFLARQSNPVEAAGYLKQAEEELAHASEITSQGLQFHRQSSAATSTNMVELLRSVLSLFAGRFQEARVHVDLATEDAPELICFPGEIRQVFVNLISNAIDSMATNGELKIRVRPSTDWRTGEHGVRVTIADTGEGMSLETRKHIYQAFFTTKGAQGSGLGLWVTSNIVKKHHGCIHSPYSTTGGLFPADKPCDAQRHPPSRAYAAPTSKMLSHAIVLSSSIGRPISRSSSELLLFEISSFDNLGQHRSARRKHEGSWFPR